MAKDDQQEAFEKLLSAGLLRVVDAVKFAETKNAALLTFSSAWILALANLLFTKDIDMYLSVVLLRVALPLFVISALIGIWTFLPRMPLGKVTTGNDRARLLLFFGDAAELDLKTHAEEIRRSYYPVEGKAATESYLDELIAQINANGKVASQKLTWFRRGAVIAAIGVILVGASAVVSLRTSSLDSSAPTDYASPDDPVSPEAVAAPNGSGD